MFIAINAFISSAELPSERHVSYVAPTELKETVELA